MTLYIDILASECHSRVLGLYSPQLCDDVTCLIVTVLDLPPHRTRSNNVRIPVFIHSNMILYC